MIPILAFVTGPEVLIVGAIILVLFGAERLPKLARSMGEAKKEFEAATKRSQEPAPPASSSEVPPVSPSPQTGPPSAPPG